MPEMPEVETIKRDLARSIAGRCFVGVSLDWPRAVQIPSPEAFCHRLKGQCINGFDRHGKYLILRLASGEALILHFMMSGSLLLDTQGGSHPYSRALFLLDDGARLHFRDPRKLGRMWLVPDESTVVGKLGPEPLSPGFTAEVLMEGVKKRPVPIKALLCDQGFLAGIGNMYADEALFAAAIHPQRRANSLSNEEIAQLHRAIRRVLEEAIGSHGASINDYRRPDGEPGTAQFIFKVAHRSGKPCPVCETPIERIPIRNRGTCFCPNCQRKA
jgi:formamidopyrimidine-DNA glycosylase